MAKYFIKWVSHCVDPFSADGHPGCFHLLVTLHNAAVHMGVQISVPACFSLILGVSPEVGLLDHKVFDIYLFEEPQNFSIAAAPFMHTSSGQGSDFSVSLICIFFFIATQWISGTSLWF